MAGPWGLWFITWTLACPAPQPNVCTLAAPISPCVRRFGTRGAIQRLTHILRIAGSALPFRGFGGSSACRPRWAGLPAVHHCQSTAVCSPCARNVRGSITSRCQHGTSSTSSSNAHSLVKTRKSAASRSLCLFQPGLTSA